MHALPRDIFAYWHQGADQLPELVEMNLERWRRLNPGWTLTLLDADDARRILADSPVDVDSVPIPALSDLLRARVLRNHGGVWVDATLYPVVPLDGWLPAAVAPSGFFTFDGPQPDRPIVSWILAAHTGSPLMRRWCEEIDRYWSQPRNVVKRIGRWPGDSIAAVSPGTEADPAPYFWLHFLFGRLVEIDAEFAHTWAATPKYAPGRCFTVWKTLKRERTATVERLRELASTSPLQKLTLDKVKYPVELLRDLAFGEVALTPSARHWTPAMAHAVVAPAEEPATAGLA